MLQDSLLVILVLLCVLLIVSLFKTPLDPILGNPCRFKILPPAYHIDGNKRMAVIELLIEKKHRYFINFPMMFKFYSNSEFRTNVKVIYINPYDKETQLLLEKVVDFNGETKEHTIYITDIFVGKIVLQVFLFVEYGNPTISLEILENSTCELTKQHKVEINFSE